MKLRLPQNLRNSLVACFCGLAAIGSTLGTGALTGGALVAALAGQAVADTVALTPLPDANTWDNYQLDSALEYNISGYTESPDNATDGVIILNSDGTYGLNTDGEDVTVYKLGGKANTTYYKSGEGTLTISGVNINSAEGQGAPKDAEVRTGTLELKYDGGGKAYVKETVSVASGAQLTLSGEDGHALKTVVNNGALVVDADASAVSYTSDSAGTIKVADGVTFSVSAGNKGTTVDDFAALLMAGDATQQGYGGVTKITGNDPDNWSQAVVSGKHSQTAPVIVKGKYETAEKLSFQPDTALTIKLETGGSLTATHGEGMVLYKNTNFVVDGGDLSVKNTLFLCGAEAAGVDSSLRIDSGTATLGGVKLQDSTASLSMNGGELCLGSGGISASAGTITLSGGTLGATANWTAALDMTLGGGLIIDNSGYQITLGGTGTTTTFTGTVTNNGMLQLAGTLALGENASLESAAGYSSGSSGYMSTTYYLVKEGTEFDSTAGAGYVYIPDNAKVNGHELRKDGGSVFYFDASDLTTYYINSGANVAYNSILTDSLGTDQLQKIVVQNNAVLVHAAGSGVEMDKAVTLKNGHLHVGGDVTSVLTLASESAEKRTSNTLYSTVRDGSVRVLGGITGTGDLVATGLVDGMALHGSLDFTGNLYFVAGDTDARNVTLAAKSGSAAAATVENVGDVIIGDANIPVGDEAGSVRPADGADVTLSKGATISNTGDLIISTGGTLTTAAGATAVAPATIANDGNVLVSGGSMTMQGNSSIANNGDVVVSDGELSLHSNIAKTSITNKGDVKVTGGELGLGANSSINNAENNGDVEVSGGELSMKSSDASITTTNISVSGTGVLNTSGIVTASNDLTVSGGTLTVGGSVTAGNQASISDGEVTVSGGTLSAAKGVTVSGGTLTVGGLVVSSIGMDISGGKVIVSGGMLSAAEGEVKLSDSAAVSVEAGTVDAQKITVSGSASLSTTGEATLTAQELVLSGGTVTTEKGTTLTLDKLTLTEGTLNLGAMLESQGDGLTITQGQGKISISQEALNSGAFESEDTYTDGYNGFASSTYTIVSSGDVILGSESVTVNLAGKDYALNTNGTVFVEGTGRYYLRTADGLYEGASDKGIGSASEIVLAGKGLELNSNLENGTTIAVEYGNGSVVSLNGDNIVLNASQVSMTTNAGAMYLHGNGSYVMDGTAALGKANFQNNNGNAWKGTVVLNGAQFNGESLNSYVAQVGGESQSRVELKGTSGNLASGKHIANVIVTDTNSLGGSGVELAGKLSGAGELKLQKGADYTISGDISAWSGALVGDTSAADAALSAESDAAKVTFSLSEAMHLENIALKGELNVTLRGGVETMVGNEGTNYTGSTLIASAHVVLTQANGLGTSAVTVTDAKFDLSKVSTVDFSSLALDNSSTLVLGSSVLDLSGTTISFNTSMSSAAQFSMTALAGAGSYTRIDLSNFAHSTAASKEITLFTGTDIMPGLSEENPTTVELIYGNRTALYDLKLSEDGQSVVAHAKGEMLIPEPTTATLSLLALAALAARRRRK